MKKGDTELLLIGAAVIIVAPVVFNGLAVIFVGTGNVISIVFSYIKYKRMVRKGLKNGSIVEVDGKYYEVTVEEA